MSASGMSARRGGVREAVCAMNSLRSSDAVTQARTRPRQAADECFEQDGRAGASRPWPIVTALIAALVLALAAWPGAAAALEFRADALAQCWRWLGGHLVHWSSEHLAWDLAAFVVLGAAVERGGRRRLLLVVLLAALAASAAVAVGRPDLTVYRGLSGVDTALLAVVVVDAIRAGRGAAAGWVTAAALAAKLLVEMTGSAVFVDAAAAGFVPVPLAHFVGAMVGALMALAVRGGHAGERCAVVEAEVGALAWPPAPGRNPRYRAWNAI